MHESQAHCCGASGARTVVGALPCQEEHQEQLKAVAELASVVAGFLMISFLQFDFPDQIARGDNQPLQLAYAATAALTVPRPSRAGGGCDSRFCTVGGTP